MEALRVTKRTGEVVDFEATRIKNAVSKAFRATEEKHPDTIVDEICDDVIAELNERFVDFYPNVENIQDVVEKQLMKRGLYEIAKSYILYRAKRAKERDQNRKENMEKFLLGKLTVKKRDGRRVLFDIQKVKATLMRVSAGLADDILTDQISKEVVKNIYEGVTTEDIERALILASTAFIEKEPSHSVVAGRLFLQKLYKEVMGKSVTDGVLDIMYRQSFVDSVKRGVTSGVYDEKLLDFDLVKLSKAINIKRDQQFHFLSIHTLYERYFMKIKDERIELPQSFWMRVAMGLAINEEQKNERAVEFYEVLSSTRFISSTPTLFHAGSSHPQLSSCYLTTINDDLKHIFKCVGDNAQLSKWSGGLGNDWSNIRATGSWIKSTNVESQGVIPFLKIANDVTMAINRSGKRRGATCAYLETWHLDIEDFLDLRKNTGDDRRRTHDMNTANWIPDLFMKRVINDETWTLFSPDEVPELHHIYGREFEKKYTEYEEKARTGEIRRHKVIPATKLWRKMLSMLFETGHPWITFKDPCNIRSPQDHVGVVHSSNLCTEITLNTSDSETAVCNLGSINLGRHVVDGKIDKDMLGETVKTAIRMLDNVIDINYYPTIEARNSNMKNRPIGLGIMGLQDAFYQMRLPFESDRAIMMSDKIMEFVSFHAIFTSSQLAKEKGAYETCKGSKWDRGLLPVDTLEILEEERGMKIPVNREETLDWTPVREHIRKHGMRNSNTMAIAPTATISTIAGCFPSIEPIYKNLYVKANISGEFTIVNHFLVNDLKNHNLWNDEMIERLKYYDGSIQLVPEIPQELKDLYKEAFEVDAEVLIKHAAARGKWIDQSQSLNIFMKGTSGRKLSEIYQYAWQMGLKTTYYLRSLGASQIEKSTLDATKYGFTQKREYDMPNGNHNSEAHKEVIQNGASANGKAQLGLPEQPSPNLCRIEDPDCEACQ